jgi:hypothetical protein
VYGGQVFQRNLCLGKNAKEVCWLHRMLAVKGLAGAFLFLPDQSSLQREALLTSAGNGEVELIVACKQCLLCAGLAALQDIVAVQQMMWLKEVV